MQEGCECERELGPGIRIMKKNYILNVIAKVLKISDTTNAAISLIDTAVFLIAVEVCKCYDNQ